MLEAPRSLSKAVPARINVEVALGVPSRQEIVVVELEAGESVARAVAASGLLERFPQVDRSDLEFAVFGCRVAADAPLSEGDRVEILRPLRVDPKEARRLRARRR